MKLLYYSPWSYGGLADYAHELANAIASLGIDVTVLCSPHYPTGRGERYQCLSILQESICVSPWPHRVLRGIRFAKITIQNYFKLADVIKTKHFQYIILGAHDDFCAPIWSPCLRQLAQKSVVFGMVVHDPVRNSVVGPHWWHRWSIASAYSFVREAFVHQAIELNTVRSIPQLRTTVIPHGPYQFGAPSLSKATLHANLNLPLNSKLMLSFGHIRDNKNLDLVLQAMVQFPDLYLMVAGDVMSASQNFAECYQELAAAVGVSERCRWQIQFIHRDEIPNLFEAADIVLLTYSNSFCSASGVLNTAVNYHRICLASSGDSPLRTEVQKYKLGIWIEPDSIEAISWGIKDWLDNPPVPEWDRYIEDNSWISSAESIVNFMKSAQPD